MTKHDEIDDKFFVDGRLDFTLYKRECHDDVAIQILIDFAEGKLDVNAFKQEFDNNNSIKKTLKNDPLCPKNTNYMPIGEKNIIKFLEGENWSTMGGQLNTWGSIERFLLRYHYLFKPTKYYNERYGFLLDIQPMWMLLDDENFLIDNVINKIPETLKTKSEKVKWCKEKIKELFKYDKSPPRWVQHAEWPIVNGKPLVFKKQSKEIPNDERVHFYFYDPDTGKETVVIQYY